MNFKLVGSTLLIVGTSIGAGMLALPIVTASLGFYGSLLLLLICWSIMTTGAFLLLEVNLWVRQNSNLITMARSTIGPFGQLLAWISFLLLLYSLLAAYIGGGSDLLAQLTGLQAMGAPEWFTASLFTGIFAAIVSFGIKMVDYTNRVLMFLKFTAYFLLVSLLFQKVDASHLIATDWAHLNLVTAVMVTITSFGFASIIPSLRVYFHGDVTQLKRAILIGSLIPLICYIAWDLVIMGIVPLAGDKGLSNLTHSANASSELVTHLSIALSNTWITVLVKIFTSVCVLTSFLGVAISLSDFLADGLSLSKKGWQLLIVQSVTFLPPLLVAVFFPTIFIKGLAYAGINCIILLVLLPAWMAYRGRYIKRFPAAFQVFGGKITLFLLISVSLGLLAWNIF